MKHILLLIGIFIFVGSSMTAQEDDQSKEERIKALKVAFITEKLELTSKDSEKFWPIYNAHEKSEREIRATGRPNKMVDEMSEAEAVAFINARLSAEKELYNLNKQYVDDMKNIITSQQMAKLLLLDREFKRKMLENIRGKRKGERKQKMKQ